MLANLFHSLCTEHSTKDPRNLEPFIHLTLASVLSAIASLMVQGVTTTMKTRESAAEERARSYWRLRSTSRAAREGRRGSRLRRAYFGKTEKLFCDRLHLFFFEGKREREKGGGGLLPEK